MYSIGLSRVSFLFLGMMLQGFRRIKSKRTKVRFTPFHPLYSSYSRVLRRGVYQNRQLGKGMGFQPCPAGLWLRRIWA